MRKSKDTNQQINDVIGELPVYSHVKTCYTVYGKSVNTDRALPLIYDGLKPVQRRALLTASKLSQGLHNATEIVGTTINLYHPHGSSGLEGAIVNLVNKYKPLLVGKGNFGKYRSLSGQQPAAAMRYVKVGASKLLTDTYAEYIDFAPTFINENDHTEQMYLPCPVPYCLLCGADGIGLGCATKIPHCDCNDLMNVVKLILEGKDKKAQSYLVHPIPDGGSGNLTITDEELKKFNTKGECQVEVSAKVEGLWDETEGRWSYVVTDFPDNINPAKILVNFRDLIREGLVYVRDESTTSLRIIVGREKRIKKITDEEVEKLLKRAVTIKCSYRNYVVTDNDVAQVVTPYQMIKAAIDKLLEAEVLSLKKQLNKLDLDILFELYKKDVANELMSTDKELSASDIIKNIKKHKKCDDLTEDAVKFIVSKSISMLKSTKSKDMDALYRQHKDIENAINDPKKYYLKTRYETIRKELCND